MPTRPEPAPTAQPDTNPADQPILDTAGNRIISPIGRHGQYVALSFWDGKRIRICGHRFDAEHLSYSEFDAGEGRFICRVCFPKAGDETPLVRPAWPIAADGEDDADTDW